MQLTARKAPEEAWAAEEASPSTPPQSEVMREYEARRCHICQCKCPPFGFGPPLATAGRVIWSCLAHRDEVDRITNGATISPTNQAPRLL
jgi:hypothetical protein